MLETVTVRRIVECHKNSLSLQWLSGEDSQDKTICRDPGDLSCLVGYLNFIHPQQITVLGEQEFTYLAKIDITEYTHAINALFAAKPVMIIVADDQNPSAEMITTAQTHATALLASTCSAQTVIDHLSHYLTSQLAQTISVHGVFMEVFDLGVLLTGDSGVGKSELALELINRGHRLIADDAPTIARTTPNTLTGSCPPLLQDFLEVRGLGIINVRAMFGATAVKDRKQLHLIVRVINISDKELSAKDRLQGSDRHCDILGIGIPEVSLPAAPGRSVAILVEAAVRNQVLKLNGFVAADLFIDRQLTTMEHAYEVDRR